MQFDISQNVKNLKGDAIKNGDADLTVGDAIIQSLVTQINEKDTEKKFKSFQLAVRLQTAVDAKTPVTLSAQEIKSILDATAASWTVLIYGRIHEALDTPLPAAEA